MLAEPIAPTVEARTYEMICEESRTYVDVGDVAAWKIGDNAIEALTAGGTLIDYAKDIRKPKGTVREFHKMSLYWDATDRAELFDTCPTITRSHMRKVLSIKDRAVGRSLVEHAARKGWTVDQFGYILQRYKSLKGIGKRPARAAAKPTSVEPVTEFVVEGWQLNAICTAQDATKLESTASYRVVVYTEREAK